MLLMCKCIHLKLYLTVDKFLFVLNECLFEIIVYCLLSLKLTLAFCYCVRKFLLKRELCNAELHIEMSTLNRTKTYAKIDN